MATDTFALQTYESIYIHIHQGRKINENMMRYLTDHAATRSDLKKSFTG